MKKYIIALSFIALFLFLNSSILKKDISIDIQTENIVVFTKIYQYLRFYHPDSDNNSKKWDYFFKNNLQKVMNLESQNVDFIIGLFSFMSESFYINKFKLISPSIDENKPKYFTEYLSYSESEKNTFYYQRRIKTLKNNHYVKFNITNSVQLIIPSYSIRKETTIYPEETNKENSDLIESIYTLIKIKCVLSNFYFDKEKRDKMDVLFSKYLKLMLGKNENKKQILDMYMAELDECHASIYTKRKEGSSSSLIMPVKWEFTEDNTFLRIIDSYDRDLIGKCVVSINNKKVSQLFHEKSKEVSGSNRIYIRNKVADNLMMVKDTNNFVLSIMDDDHPEDFKISVNFMSKEQYFKWEEESSSLFYKAKISNNSMVYVDLTKGKFDDKTSYMKQECNKDKYLFIDLRGYPNDGSFHSLLSHFYKKEVKDEFLQVPTFSIDSFYYTPLSWTIKPSKDFVIEYKKIFILVNEQTMSYSESLAYFLRKLPNSYLVGNLTAGCNGNITYLDLDAYMIRFTGMKVIYSDVKSDKGKLLPDYNVDLKNFSVKSFLKEELYD